MKTGVIFDIREFAIHDGPGLRTSVFLKGCPLRCNWCHNPEGLLPGPEIRESGTPCIRCGKCLKGCNHPACRPFGRCLHVCPLGRFTVCGSEWEAAALAAHIRRQEHFLQNAKGGVTLTGGEPLMQGEFLLELIEMMKPLHIAIETSGHVDARVFEDITAQVDLTIMDLKHMDDGIHRKYTGVGNALILGNASRLIASGRPFIARVPLIPGVTDTVWNLDETAKLLAGAKGLLRVELLPYNALAGAKYASVGREYRPDFDTQARPNADIRVFLSRGIPYAVL